VSKGSKPRPVNRQKFAANFDRIFGEKRPNPDVDQDNRARYKVHPETGELVPDYMWHQLGLLKITPKTHFVLGDAEAYRCPITGKVVDGRRQHRNNLARHDCRVYEGRAIETQEANNHKAHQERKLSDRLDKTMPKTLNDIKYQNNPPPEIGKNGKAKISWTWGE